MVPLVAKSFDDIYLFQAVKEKTKYTDEESHALFSYLLQQSIDHELAFGGFLKSGELVGVMCNTLCDKFELDLKMVPESMIGTLQILDELYDGYDKPVNYADAFTGAVSASYRNYGLSRELLRTSIRIIFEERKLNGIVNTTVAEFSTRRSKSLGFQEIKRVYYKDSSYQGQHWWTMHPKYTNGEEPYAVLSQLTKQRYTELKDTFA